MAGDKRTWYDHPPSHDYPRGRREETSPVMVRGLYGHPGSGKAWNKEKIKILLGLMFNWCGHQPPAPPAGHSSLPLALMRKRKYVVEWRSKACRYDATAFVFVRTDNNNETKRAIMVTYVDDLDVGIETQIMSVYMWAVLGARVGHAFLP